MFSALQSRTKALIAFLDFSRFGGRPWFRVYDTETKMCSIFSRHNDWSSKSWFESSFTFKRHIIVHFRYQWHWRTVRFWDKSLLAQKELSFFSDNLREILFMMFSPLQSRTKALIAFLDFNRFGGRPWFRFYDTETKMCCIFSRHVDWSSKSWF